MVSVKDISKVCGVSVATVSKALNGQKDIGEATKEHIRRVAREMGYFPNSSARALKTNRTYNIGVLFADAAQSGLTHDFFSYVLDSFKRTVESRGFDITFINANNNESGMTYLDHCRYRGFDGVVVACVDFHDPQVLELANSNLPVVMIDHSFDNRIAIISDNERGIKDLVTYIINCGHRRIAYIHGLSSSVTEKRLNSFYSTMRNFGIEVRDEYLLEAPYRNTSIAEEMTYKLLDLPEPPTCILYPDDFSCFGGINAINQRGLRIPEDISVAGYDGIRIGRHIEPQLTTIRQNTEEIGHQAGVQLIDLIEHPGKSEIHQIIIPGSLFSGKTVGQL